MMHYAMCGGTMARVPLPRIRRADHIMGMPVEKARRWTAREVRQLIADSPLATPRYELVDGELLVTPSPAPAHQEAVARLLVALREYLERERVGHALDSPSDIELEPDDLRQPDVYVLPMAEWKRILRDGFPARELLLAVEVLSPSSGRHDRVRKRPGYQRRVSDYWIVDVDARLMERWRTTDTRPEILTDQITWAPPGATAPFVLELPGFFRKVWSEEE
jgi:Uma2 family endonuclease